MFTFNPLPYCRGLSLDPRDPPYPQHRTLMRPSLSPLPCAARCSVKTQ